MSIEHLRFIDVMKENYQIWRSFLIENEMQYPQVIRWGDDEFFNTLNEFSFIVLLDGFPVGHLFAGKPEPQDREYFDVEEGDLYLYDLTVRKGFHGHGYGGAMFRELLFRAREKGFSRLVGHFHQGASEHIARRAGGVELKRCPDWKGCGEDYIQFVLFL